MPLFFFIACKVAVHIAQVVGETLPYVVFDTKGEFTSGASWEAVDIAHFFPAIGEARGYNGAVYDGRFIYYMPYHQKPMYCLGYHGKAVRYDTHAPFHDKTSWKAMDIETIFGPKIFATGYVNGVYAGHYIYAD